MLLKLEGKHQSTDCLTEHFLSEDEMEDFVVSNIEQVFFALTGNKLVSFVRQKDFYPGDDSPELTHIRGGVDLMVMDENQKVWLIELKNKTKSKTFARNAILDGAAQVLYYRYLWLQYNGIGKKENEIGVAVLVSRQHDHGAAVALSFAPDLVIGIVTKKETYVYQR